MVVLLRFLIIGFLIYWFFIRQKRFRASRVGKKQSFSQTTDKNPYEVLRVSTNADPGEIKKAYHEALSKHHPDKVEHLGEDLQILAKEKTAEIMKAYETLRKQRAF